MMSASLHSGSCTFPAVFAVQIVHKMLNAAFSSHPDFEHIRGLGSTYQDPSMEPNRFTSYTTVTDYNQTRSEWVDVDIEMENKLNSAYAEVGSKRPHTVDW